MPAAAANERWRCCSSCWRPGRVVKIPGVWRVAIIGALMTSPGSHAQVKRRTVWDGVFSEEQAARGKPQFEANCGRCHNDALIGSQSGPALKGPTFLRRWSGDTVGSLYVTIRDSMPNDANLTESVPEQTKLDIVAYILSANGAPAGREPLPLDRRVLENTLFSRDREAPMPPPDRSLVQVSGCLRRRGPAGWALVHATEPEAVDAVDPGVTASESAAPSTGPLTYSLFSVPVSFTGDAGSFVQVRGFVLRWPGDDRLTAVEVRVRNGTCPQP